MCSTAGCQAACTWVHGSNKGVRVDGHGCREQVVASLRFEAPGRRVGAALTREQRGLRADLADLIERLQPHEARQEEARGEGGGE